MYSCEDLSPAEHTELQALTRRRNRRTGFVEVNGTTLSVLDALAEMGFLRRQGEGRVLVINPCPGHTKDTLFDQGICVPRTLGTIPAQPGRHVRARSVAEEAEKAHSSAAGADVCLSIKGLTDKFAMQCRLYNWSSAPSRQGRLALGASFKRWVGDGATLEEIDRLIDLFFADINSRKKQKHAYLWKMFLARKESLHMALQREHAAIDMSSHRYDPTHWSGK